MWLVEFSLAHRIPVACFSCHKINKISISWLNYSRKQEILLKNLLQNQQNLKARGIYSCTGIYFFKSAFSANLFYFFRLFYFVFFGRFILLFSVLSLPTIHSALAKFFFNSKKLVILSHSVRARRRTGFNLSGIHADCNVCNRSVFRFT